MSEEINKIFEQWKQFLSWCYENNDKTTEIHRDNLEKVMEYTEKLENQLQQEENILKEAREYIEPIVELDNDIMLKGKMLKPVLEILDKRSSNGSN